MNRVQHDNIVAISMTGAVLAGILVIFAGVKISAAERDWKACVNQIAHHAYVEADVGDTFNSGFDAGLYAAKICGVEK